MNLKLNETLEERMERFEESKKKDTLDIMYLQKTGEKIYGDDLYSDEDNFWDKLYPIRG